MVKSVESICDDFFNIQTEAKYEEGDFGLDRRIFSSYFPTSYSVLENLFQKYPFEENDHIIDFGCGKGRVLIMASYYSCKYITGYEVNNDRYHVLLKNIENFRNKYNNNYIFTILNENVEKIEIKDNTNKYFFFNPFHLKIYIKVLNQILASLQRHNRDLYIYF